MKGLLLDMQRQKPPLIEREQNGGIQHLIHLENTQKHTSFLPQKMYD